MKDEGVITAWNVVLSVVPQGPFFSLIMLTCSSMLWVRRKADTHLNRDRILNLTQTFTLLSPVQIKSSSKNRKKKTTSEKM